MKQNPSKQPFAGKKVYYCGSITGVAEIDLELPHKLVSYMKNNGANVLDEHVSIPHKGDEFVNAMVKDYRISLEEWNNLTKQEQSKLIYTRDIGFVDQADYIVALLNGTSFGVGMELQRALDKPKNGKNLTPILGLVHEDFMNKVSLMITGASEIFPHLSLKTYKNLKEAQTAIFSFLYYFS